MAKPIVLLVLVYADAGLLTDAERARVEETLRTLDRQVLLRFFSYDELARRFGALDG